MNSQRCLCFLLALLLLSGALTACGDKKGGEAPPPTSNHGAPPTPPFGGGGGGGGVSSEPELEKYPWLHRVYRFSEEAFTMAPDEREGILAYLKGLGAIAVDETDEEKITEVLDMLAYAERREVQFQTERALRIVSEDYIYEAEYLYKVDVYKNVALYGLDDTAMKNKLSSPAYTLSPDGKVLTLKVPFSYVTVDGEGNPTTVNCRSYSTLTFTRDEAVRLDAVPTVENKSYKLANYALRFADDAAREVFELEQGMAADAWLAQKNATVSESNSGVLRMEAGNKLVCERIVGNGISISEFAYYVSIGAGGAVTLYNTEKGRDDQDENDVVDSLSVFFTADGKTAAVTEGTGAQRLRVYRFDRELGEEILPGVSGKAYKLTSHTYRFASDGDRMALEAEKGKALDAIIAELNATITEAHYKTLVITDDGKIVCETMTESGSVISGFTYYAVIRENGTTLLYKTAAGRDAANAEELVDDISITVTASGIELATPVFAGSESVRIEVYQFDREFKEESVSDPKGNAYKLSEHGFRFASEEDIAALETAEGKTVAEIIAELNATITDACYKTLVITDDGKIVCETMTESGAVISGFTYYAVIRENGTMLLYKTAAGRDAEKAEELVDGLSIAVTANGIELATPLFAGGESVRIEIYAFERVLEKESVSDPRGNAHKLFKHGFRFASEEDLAALEAAEGKTVAEILAALNAGVTEGTYRMLTVSKNGTFACVAIAADGVTASVFAYCGVIGEDGRVTLYKTAAGRDKADASELVTDVTIAVTAKGILVSTPIPEAPASVQTELYVLDKELEESIPGTNGNRYLLNGYRYHFESAEALKAFEAAKGKTVSEVLAEERAAITSANGMRAEFEKSGTLRLYQVFDGYTVRVLYGYYDVAEDGTVTLYTLPLDREDKTLVETDLRIRITAGGIEISEPFEGGRHIGLYTYESTAPVYNGPPTVAGSCFVSTRDNEIQYTSMIEKDRLDGTGMTSEFLLGLDTSGNYYYLDQDGRMFCITVSNGIRNLSWLYYYTVEENGSITRYKTENGRDNQFKSDVVKDGVYFYASPDGTSMEMRTELMTGSGSRFVTSLAFEKTIETTAHSICNRMYQLDGEETYWYIDETGRMSVIQNDQIVLTYYAAVDGTGNLIVYYDAAHTNRVNTEGFSGSVLFGGQLIYLKNKTTVRAVVDYTSANHAAITVNSGFETKYVEGQHINIQPGSYTTNSDGAVIVEWFRVSGNVRTKISSKNWIDCTKGNYVVKLTVLPSEKYKMTETEVAFTVITKDELLQGYTELGIIVREYSTQIDRFDVVKGQKYAVKIHIHGYATNDSSRVEKLASVVFSMNVAVDVYVRADGTFYHYGDAYINSENGALYVGPDKQYAPVIYEESDYGGSCDSADTLWILFTATKTGTLEVSTD